MNSLKGKVNIFLDYLDKLINPEHNNWWRF